MTVFTITYDQRERILALLADLERQDYPLDLLDVLVLDDGSGDGTGAAVQERAEEVQYNLDYLHRDHEADYLSARRWNECIAAARERTRVFVQVDDVRARPDFVRRHVDWHAGRMLRVVTGAKFEADRETWDLTRCARAHLAGDGGTAREHVPWTAVWGASLSYPAALVESLRRPPHELPYDERMTGWGYHEVELAYRATLAGATIVYDPAVGVFHRNHGPESDAGRAIDHAREREIGGERNVRYLLDKHGLAELPRW